MTRDALRHHLHAAGLQPANLNIRWDSLALPTREWVRGEFHRTVVGWARAIGIQHYREGVRNCRLYSDFAKVIAHACHARSSDADTMLAFGDLEYWRGDGQHAVCVAVHGPADFTFYDLTAALGNADPFHPLNDQERASCYELRF